MIMPLATYEVLHNNSAMPLPIPKPASANGIPDPHYMTFDEAVKQPFTYEHQTSLQTSRIKNSIVVYGDVSLGERETKTSSKAETNKVTQDKLIRGLVSCKDCTKPRCLYSAISPNRMKTRAIIVDPEPNAESIRLCLEYAIENFDEAQNIAINMCAGCSRLMPMTRCMG